MDSIDDQNWNDKRRRKFVIEIGGVRRELPIIGSAKLPTKIKKDFQHFVNVFNTAGRRIDSGGWFAENQKVRSFESLC